MELKFKVFDADLQRQSNYAPTITIKFKNGNFSLNILAQDHMKLNHNDRVALLQDESRPTDWYVTIAPNGVRLAKKPNSMPMTFCHKFCARALQKSLNIQSDLVRIRIGDPVKNGENVIWPLITKAVEGK